MLLFLIAGPLVMLIPLPASAVTVRPGQSIQSAIDNAAPGSTIALRAGVYREQLVIKMSGLRLVGNGATLEAPTTLTPNACTDVTRVGPPDGGVSTDAGICVVGDVTFGDFDPVLTHRPATLNGTRISHVSISGLTISGFGTGIIIAGAEKTTIEGVAISKAESYGILAANAPKTSYVRNKVMNGPNTIAAIGMCIEGSPGSDLRLNEVSGYIVGLCISSSKVKVTANHVHDNHMGIYIDPGFSDIGLIENKITRNTRQDPAPLPTGIGVAIDGASDVRLIGNTISGNIADNRADFGGLGAGGLVIFDHEAPPPRFMSSNVVAKGNRFANNGDGQASADVWLASQGTGMLFTRNPGCLTSSPAGLC